MNRNLIVVVLALVAALSPRPAAAAVASLVADIDPRFESEGSRPEGFVRVGGRVLFRAGPEGRVRLWSTNGAAVPVALGPADLTAVENPRAALGRAFFYGCRDGSGCALWSSNGTSAGTRLLKPVSHLQLPSEALVRQPGANRIFLAFDGGPQGRELWSSDGTPAGTRLVADLNDNSDSDPRSLVWFRGRLWFVADARGAFGALFSSDGTGPGTKRAGTVEDVLGLAVVGNRLLFFSAPDDGTDALELWSSDGTPAGTKRIVVGVEASFDPPPSIVAAGGKGYFFASAGSSSQLWVTDGTPAGTTVRLASSSTDFTGPMVAVGSRLAFLFPGAGGTELWSSDGTAAGTKRVLDICRGACDGALALAPAALGRVWLHGFTPARGVEVWTSDLTAAGTRLLRDICPGSCGSSPGGFLAAGPRVYFTAVASDLRTSALWVSDGTAAGTRELAPFAGFEGLEGVPVGASSIVYAGTNEAHGREPWVSDGTPAGTRELADLDADNQIGSDPEPLGSVGGRGFFLARDPDHGRQLWSSDGTEAGTRLALELTPDFDSWLLDAPAASSLGRFVLTLQSSTSNSLQMLGSDGTPAGSGFLLPEGVSAQGVHRVVAGRLFFLATDSEHGTELWTTDGTAAGTLRLTDLAPPSPFRPGSRSPLFPLRNRVVAPVLSPGGGEELWISDGTPAGTKRLQEVYPFLDAPLLAAAGDPVDLGGSILFAAGRGSVEGTRVWRTDLTAAGTEAIGPLEPTDPDAAVEAAFALDGRMLVFGSSVFGDTLWTSDGTAAGTHPVKVVSLGRDVEPLAAIGRLWFADRTGRFWATDGTGAGTVPVVDAAQNPLRVFSLASLGDEVVFAPEQYAGLWATDGTPAGTRAIPLPPSAQFDDLPSLAARTPTRVFFNGSDPLHGAELWTLEP